MPRWVGIEILSIEIFVIDRTIANFTKPLIIFNWILHNVQLKKNVFNILKDNLSDKHIEVKRYNKNIILYIQCKNFNNYV